MIKDFLLVRHQPAVPRKQMQDYLQFSHAPLAMTLPLLAEVTQRYTMNQVEDDPAGNLMVHPPLPDFATIVEHQFGEGIERLHDDETYISDIRPDEMYMIEALMAGPPQFLPIDQEQPIFTSDQPARARVFDFVRRPRDMPRDVFLAKLAEEAAWAKDDAHYREAAARRVDSIVGTGTGAADFGDDLEAIDAVVEVWVADPAKLAALIDERRRRRAGFCDPVRSFTAVTQEHWLKGAADAFGPRSVAA